MTNKPEQRYKNIAVDPKIHTKFRKVCIASGVKPHDVAEEILANWTEIQIHKYKIVLPGRPKK